MTTPKHQRRIRYKGKYPRAFTEKYKEQDPARYAGEVRKIMASGKTPAGMHRPICVAEIMEVLHPKPGEVAVDATLGYGGHALEIARAVLPGGKLIGLDADPIELPRTEARLIEAGIPAETLIARRTNYAAMARVLGELGIREVDMVLADLGLSSMQIDNPERGFTFKREGPLDMRMNPHRGRPASDWLRKMSEEELTRAFRENADEPRAEAIARGICEARKRAPVLTTLDLAGVIRQSLGAARRDGAEEIEGSIRRTFQALRILVNDEFGALDLFLKQLPECLRPGGRVAILTFHSGEDRRVKNAFRAGLQSSLYSSVNPEVIRPGAEEIRSNPRSAAAKLRWAIKA